MSHLKSISGRVGYFCPAKQKYKMENKAPNFSQTAISSPPLHTSCLRTRSLQPHAPKNGSDPRFSLSCKKKEKKKERKAGSRGQKETRIRKKKNSPLILANLLGHSPELLACLVNVSPPCLSHFLNLWL